MRCTIPLGETASLAGVTVKALNFDLLQDHITIEITPGETLDEPRERTFEEFQAFVREHPATLTEFRNEVLSRLERHRRVSARDAMLAVRRSHRANRGRYRLAMRNEFSGYFARLLLTERPELKPRLGTDVPSDPRFKTLLREIGR